MARGCGLRLLAERQPVRIPRWTIVLSAGAVAVALATLVASIVLVSTEEPTIPATPRPSPSAAQEPASAADVALREVLDPERALAERTLSLKRLSKESSDAGPIVRVLRSLPATSPEEVQVRAMALTALGKFPSDLAAREFLVVLAFQRGSPRDERVLALEVLSTRTDLAECRKPLAVLAKDPEPAVATRAKRLLASLGDR